MKSSNGKFTVLIIPGVENDQGQVLLPHGAAYTIKLINDYGLPCDATVKVDGEEIGVFRVDGGGYFDDFFPISRHGRIRKQLTFYKSGTREAKMGFEGEIADENMGLVSVTFVPQDDKVKGRSCGNENSHILAYDHGIILECGISGGGDGALESARSGEVEQNLSAGMTALGADSDQEFIPAPYMPLNQAEAQVVNLRLVCDNELQPVGVTPFPGRNMSSETPVPPTAPRDVIDE